MHVIPAWSFIAQGSVVCLTTLIYPCGRDIVMYILTFNYVY